MLRIGIVGLSGFAANHWRGLEEAQRSGACQIVAAAVIDPERHTAALEALRGRGVTSSTPHPPCSTRCAAAWTPLRCPRPSTRTPN